MYLVSILHGCQYNFTCVLLCIYLNISLDLLLKFTKCLISQRVSNAPLVKAECQIQAAWIEVDECRQGVLVNE